MDQGHHHGTLASQHDAGGQGLDHGDHGGKPRVKGMLAEQVGGSGGKHGSCQGNHEHRTEERPQGDQSEPCRTLMRLPRSAMKHLPQRATRPAYTAATLPATFTTLSGGSFG